MKRNNNLPGRFYNSEIRRNIEEMYGKKYARSLAITGAAAMGAMMAALGKLVMGILALSLFTCANAFYSFGMIGAKIIAVYGMQKTRSIKEQYRYYRLSGLILIISSFIYIVYSIRLFEHPIRSTYHMYLALSIATVTFTEIILNMRGVLMTRKRETLLIHAVKRINLSGALISLVLTQTALLSVSEMNATLEDISNANGAIGVIMGGVAMILGFTMVFMRNKQREEIRR